MQQLLDFRPQFTDGTRVAPNPLQLVDVRTSLNFPALSVFFRLGFFVGDDTPFQGIRQILPKAPPVAKPTSVTREQAIRTYAELFERAVARSLPAGPNIYAPLSGGRDSRHIAFALYRLGALPDAFITHYHVPPHPNDDVVVARLVAQQLGTEWIGIRQPKFFARNIVRAFKETGFLADEHAQMLPCADWLRSKANHIYDGIGGDMMSAGLFQQDRELDALYRRGHLGDVATRLLQSWGKERLGWQDLIDPKTAPLVSQEVAKRRLIEELDKHVAHHNPLRSFFFWNRTRREIALAPFMLYRGHDIHTPYLDADLWEFLDSLPYEMVADGNFHTDTILHAYPQFTDIRFENKAKRSFTRPEAIAFALDFLRVGTELKSTKLLKRGLSLFRNGESWWSRVMALYIPALYRTVSSGAHS